MRYALAICLVFLMAGAACAQTSQPATISLQLSDTDVVQAFATLSEKAGISIMGDATVKGKVSCSLSGVTAEQALDTICKMNKLEWYKTHASLGTGTDAKASASKLFKLMDALKELGGSAVICNDPKTKTQTVFVPSTASGSVDASAIASGLKLKEVYLVRAIPDPAAKSANAQPKNTLQAGAMGDATAAANQLWDYFSQMPMETQLETMSQLRRRFYDSMTPEQRDQLRQYFQQRYGSQNRDGNRDGRGGRPN